MSVVRSSTRQPPIFLGPMFLHGDGAFVSYLTFFMSMRGALDSDVHATELKMLDGIITGADEEAALMKALRVAFPSSQHLFCVLHCRDNVCDHLNKMGVTQNVREQIIQSLFGANGLALSPDESVFEDRRASVLQYVRQYCPGAQDYIGLRVIPKLLNNCTTLWRAPWLGPQRWTNNACESVNNIIKLALDWKPARLTDLVRHLHELVTAQYKSVERAMIGQGDFVVADSFKHHCISYCHWQGLSEEQGSQQLRAFLADTGLKAKKDGTETSSDGVLTIQGTNKVARKPGQGRRPRSERAANHKKT